MFSAKKTLRIAILSACTLGLGLGGMACSHPDMGMAMSGKELSKPDKTIAQIAAGDNMGDVSTVVTLLGKAGLVDTLNGPGPFTVFAPTNEAFAKFKVEHPDKYAYVTDDAHVDALKQVLLYHVVPGKHMSSDIMTMTAQSADDMKPIQVSKDSMGVMLNGSAKVVKPDIEASNGVIHWIDTVLVPPGM